jgi:hypothetical protein
MKAYWKRCGKDGSELRRSFERKFLERMGKL